MGRVISGLLLETGTWKREHGQTRSLKKGGRPLAFTFLLIIGLIIFYLFFVWSRLWVTNLGYSVSEALKEQNDLIEINKRLGIERATLISPKRIGVRARERLGMREPREDEVRFVK